MDEKELMKAYQTVFTMPEGQAVMLDLAQKCKIGMVSEMGTPADHLQYIEGARSMYAYICQMIETG